jgi:aspartate/methionine/tyrosine aminotransferase
MKSFTRFITGARRIPRPGSRTLRWWATFQRRSRSAACGWAGSWNAARREEYLNAREYVTVSNTPVGEFLGEIAIRHHQQVLGRTREVTRANLELLESAIAQAAGVLDWIRPSGGMTAWVQLVSGGDARRFCEEALKFGLLLAPGDCWGFPDHFRIGFGVGREWYPRAMERFQDLIRTRSTAAGSKAKP